MQGDSYSSDTEVMACGRMPRKHQLRKSVYGYSVQASDQSEKETIHAFAAKISRNAQLSIYLHLIETKDIPWIRTNDFKHQIVPICTCCILLSEFPFVPSCERSTGTFPSYFCCVHGFRCIVLRMFDTTPYDVSIFSDPSKLVENDGRWTESSDCRLSQVCTDEQRSDEHVIRHHPSEYGGHDDQGSGQKPHEIIRTHPFRCRNVCATIYFGMVPKQEEVESVDLDDGLFLTDTSYYTCRFKGIFPCDERQT